MRRAKIFLIVILLLFCFACIAYAAVQAFLPEDEPASPSLKHSGKTTVEKRTQAHGCAMTYLSEIYASLTGLWDFWTTYLEVH